MWAPLSFVLLIAVVAQATGDSTGLAIGFGVALVVAVGITVARRTVTGGHHR
jgi:hypothetical protein